jgi:hypothetical protein
MVVCVDSNSCLFLSVAQDVRVSGVDNGHYRAVEEFTAGSSKSSIVTSIVVDGALGQHGVVLNLRFAKVRAVGRNENHLGLGHAESLDGGLVPQNGLSGSHDKLKAGVHRVLTLLLSSKKASKG